MPRTSDGGYLLDEPWVKKDYNPYLKMIKKKAEKQKKRKKK